MSQEILDKLKQGVIDYDEDAVMAAANEALAQNVDPYSAVFDGLVPGMVEVGRLYEEQEYFVPEMLMCADAMYASRPSVRGTRVFRTGDVNVCRRYVRRTEHSKAPHD